MELSNTYLKFMRLYSWFWRTPRKSLVLKNRCKISNLFVNYEILLECLKNSHWKGRMFRRYETKIQFYRQGFKKKCRTQIREQMSGPEISWYEKSILGCGLWSGLDWVDYEQLLRPVFKSFLDKKLIFFWKYFSNLF